MNCASLCTKRFPGDLFLEIFLAHHLTHILSLWNQYDFDFGKRENELPPVAGELEDFTRAQDIFVKNRLNVQRINMAGPDLPGVAFHCCWWWW